MATPFTVSGELLLPVDPGQPNSTAPYGFAGTFESKVDLELNYTGSATETVPLGTPEAEGLKMLLVELDEGAGVAPVKLRFNGGTAPSEIEISPGGFCCVGSPAPAAGITALSITHTTECKLRVRALS